MPTTNIPQVFQENEKSPPLNLETDFSANSSPLDQGPQGWEDTFQKLFDNTVDAYAGGTREFDQLLSEEDRAFLGSIGASPQEISDFVEDWSEEGVPTPQVIREITGVRRDYFLTVQEGQLPPPKGLSDVLPSPSASLGGHPWLPRIIGKARAKLRGELPPHIMYGCGMDRAFLQKVNIGLAEFLRLVWETWEDEGKILHYVNQQARRPTLA